MSGPDQDYDATYAYDTKGRLNQVLGPGVDTTNGVRYERFSDSDAVQYVRYKDSNNANVVTTERYLESDRDMLDKVENRINGDPDTVVSRYRYGFEEGQDPAELLDALGRRTAVIMSGSAFDDYGDHHWDFGYNDRNEVTAGNRREGTTVQQGNFMTPGDYDYTYDPIGNRTETNVDNQQNPMTYTRNNVNQYTDTAYPTESFTYDDDGNLTADGTYTYVWDAENRLKEVQATSPEAGSKKLVFAYDYMNRRVCKQLFMWNTGTSDWNATPASDKRFVYDGWNVVLLLNGASGNALIRKLTWGLDLSGLAGSGSISGIHGAGGIGGLLAHQSSTGTSNFWYLYDGNGNVCQILDRSYLPNVSWTTSGHFEYDAYGNIVHSRGVMGGVAQRAFCFSTKWLDTELAGAGINGAMGSTGMYYYGYRYYLPRIGRWGNHDPIEEAGGLNLYGFAGNGPASHVDPDGRTIVAITGFMDMGSGSLKTMVQMILNRVNDWRKSVGLPEDTSHVFTSWATGRVSSLSEEARKYRDTRKTRCDAQGFVVLGYSDGATTLYRWLQDHAREDFYVRDVEFDGERYQGFVAASYVAFIDMVRDDFYSITPDKLLKKEHPYENRDLPLDFAPILHGDAFYQDYTAEANIFELSVAGWRGYKTIGASGSVHLHPTNHMRIINEPRLQTLIINDAVNAYIEHVQSILRRRQG